MDYISNDGNIKVYGLDKVGFTCEEDYRHVKIYGKGRIVLFIPIDAGVVTVEFLSKNSASVYTEAHSYNSLGIYIEGKFSLYLYGYTYVRVRYKDVITYAYDHSYIGTSEGPVYLYDNSGIYDLGTIDRKRVFDYRNK